MPVIVRAKIAVFPVSVSPWPTLQDAHTAAEQWLADLVASDPVYYATAHVIDRLDGQAAGIYVGTKPLSVIPPDGAAVEVYNWAQWVSP